MYNFFCIKIQIYSGKSYKNTVIARGRRRKKIKFYVAYYANEMYNRNITAAVRENRKANVYPARTP